MQSKEVIDTLMEALESLREQGTLTEEAHKALVGCVDGVLTRFVLFLAGNIYDHRDGVARILTADKYISMQTSKAIQELLDRVEKINADENGGGTTH